MLLMLGFGGVVAQPGELMLIMLGFRGVVDQLKAKPSTADAFALGRNARLGWPNHHQITRTSTANV